MKTPPLNPTVFILIRHAQTVWNKDKRHTGSIEVPLAPRAEGQIARVTRLLTSLQPQAVYSSPLSRCQLTIGPTAEILDLPVITHKGLIERSLGSWEGKSPEELLPTHPGYIFPQSAYTGDFRITGAETLEDLESRIRKALREMQLHHPGETILVSTHSGVIWTIVHRIVTNPPETFFWPGNCSVTRIESEGNHYRFASFSPLP